MTTKLRGMLGLVAAAALIVGACSSDDGDGGANGGAGDSGADQTTTTNGATGPTGSTTQAAAAFYGGHDSDVYSDADHWLCRPDLDEDACSLNLDTTIVQPDGTTAVEKFEPDADAPIDCFYVYPTISADPTPNSDLEPGAEELQVIANQTARMTASCRVYAPVYRQVTLGALMGLLGGAGDGRSQNTEQDSGEGDGTGDGTGDGDSGEGEDDGATPTNPDRDLAYNDVVDAWKHYMDNYNNGRGVILIGHSQGTGVLTKLIAEEIDEVPELRERLISAYLIGGAVAVPPGEDVGGSFKNVPACRSREQTGCVVSFASFRADDSPTTALFGRPRDAGEQELEALCVNPAALEGGPAPLLHHLTTSGPGAFADPARNSEIETMFIQLPGLITGECVSKDGSNYLAVTVNADPNDARADDIGGDFLPGWGLHLIDMNLAMGDFVELARSQGDAWLAGTGGESEPGAADDTDDMGSDGADSGDADNPDADDSDAGDAAAGES